MCPRTPLAQAAHALDLLPMPAPFSPPIPGSWQPLTSAESRRFTRHLDRHLRASGLAAPAFSQQCPILALHAVPLSFYQGWVLVTGECSLKQGRKLANFDVLLGPGFIWCLDGLSTMVHAINAGAVRRPARLLPGAEVQSATTMPSPLQPLEPRVTGPDYLRFFCHAMRTAGGSFRIIDNVAQLQAYGAQGDPQALAGVIVPLRAGWCRSKRTRPADGTASMPRAVSVRGSVLYDGTLFEARFRIGQDGHVTMESQKILASDVAPVEVTQRWLRTIRPAPSPLATC